MQNGGEEEKEKRTVFANDFWVESNSWEFLLQVKFLQSIEYILHSEAIVDPSASE